MTNQPGICSADFIPCNFLAPRVNVERRSDGSIILNSPEPLGPYPRCIGEHLERWATERPGDVFIAQREGDGWRKLTWAEARSRARSIATSILQRNLSVNRPIAILSGNSIDHAVMALAAMHVGIPIAPISPGYSLLSEDFAKLKSVFNLLNPGLVFAEDGDPFARAIHALAEFEFELVVARNCNQLPKPPLTLAELETKENPEIVDRAFRELSPDTVAKFLLTSGSTGEPKAVVNTQRMLCSNQQSLTQAWPFLDDEPPVLVDWLPWNHTFGGNNNFGMVLTHGGTLYIDEGKPAPGQIETTVNNLREISPTVYYNAPRGYDALAPYLENDPALRRNFFARLRVMCYSGAGMPVSLWERLERIAISELGKRVPMSTGWGATETAPQVTLIHFEPIRPSVLGLPTPGCEVKMIPVDTGKYELRVRGPNVMPGYWKRPELNAAAFDDEGFYRIGDAGRFADPDDPTRGLEFAGRLSEDFKLTTGTWVHVGPLRVRAISALAPVAQDIVVSGDDRNEVGLLIFPNIDACRGLCTGHGADKPLNELLADPGVRDRVRSGMAALKAEGHGSSMFATRAIFLEEPPSHDAGEITDKGYINQRAVLARRSSLVDRLYSGSPDEDVITLD